MWPFAKSPQHTMHSLPLFPLKTVLFPGGLLPLKIFEQRYIDMAKSCLKDSRPFGVCLLTQGEEVATAAGATPEIEKIGTLARITDLDMPQLGILHVITRGETRFRVEAQRIEASGLMTGDIATIPPEPEVSLADTYRPLANLLELIATRVGPQNFPAERALDDASWVGYRLVELLPLPLHIKQTMLEINDPAVRLQVLQKFLAQQGVIP
jgi:Lon protease-like protein